jgi:phosphatidylserine synthase
MGYGMGLRGAASLALVGYTLGAVWRLARFHEVGTVSGRGGVPAFQGMPTTFAAGLFYLVAGVTQWLPAAFGWALLILFFLASALLMNGRFAFPKTGWHTRLLWLLVPVALVALLIRQW